MTHLVVADAAIRHRAWLRESAPTLEKLHAAFTQFDGESGLLAGDMLTLAATVKEYKPDLVIELGRSWGCSTALFRYLEVPQVVSICNTDVWEGQTVPVLSKVLPEVAWRSGVKAIVGDILDQDYGSLAASAKERAFIFWDAHGYDIAETVFGSILPALEGREVIVACHDMRDSRYMGHDRPPPGSPLWRRQEEPYARFLRLGNVHSSFEQLVSITDFVSWRSSEFHSPLHQIMTNPEALQIFPFLAFGWPYCLWHYFEGGV